MGRVALSTKIILRSIIWNAYRLPAEPNILQEIIRKLPQSSISREQVLRLVVHYLELRSELIDKLRVPVDNPLRFPIAHAALSGRLPDQFAL
jgi:hypothetical protein